MGIVLDQKRTEIFGTKNPEGESGSIRISFCVFLGIVCVVCVSNEAGYASSHRAYRPSPRSVAGTNVPEISGRAGVYEPSDFVRWAVAEQH